jgi:hypothetical protein
VGADEQRPTGLHAAAGREVSESPRFEVDITPAAVAGRAVAGDHVDLLQHVEMMREKVGRKVEAGGELDRRTIGERQIVDNGQSDGVAEGGVAQGTASREIIDHSCNITVKIY